MSLKSSEIERLAKLARLELTSAEQEKFSQEISVILQYVESLQEIKDFEVNLSELEPKSLLRTDFVKPVSSEIITDILQQAPDLENSLIKTKPVFERD